MRITISSRRVFLGTTALATAGAAVSLRTAVVAARAERVGGTPADTGPAKRYKLIAFTKPFRQLDAASTADLVAQVGWDGVELPVRSRDGQITPDNAEDELPKFVEALKVKGREVSIVTTEILEANAKAEKLLTIVSKLGIKRYRLGSLMYAKEKAVAQQLSEFAPRLRDLAALNKQLGIQGGFQNHSGVNYVGAPVWDVWTLIRDLDPKAMGFCFDIGHATVEGGQSWGTTFRAIQPWLTAVFVKDFTWQKTTKGWRPVWCPLGEGMVSPSFFQMLKQSNYTGPICQHHEYELGATPITHYKRDLEALQKILS